MQAWHSLFARNMFIRPDAEELGHFAPQFTVVHAPNFRAEPERDGTRSEAFVILNFAKRLVHVPVDVGQVLELRAGERRLTRQEPQPARLGAKPLESRGDQRRVLRSDASDPHDAAIAKRDVLGREQGVGWRGGG